jgi:glycosyltransferase involved in cell wall biosynthesis
VSPNLPSVSIVIPARDAAGPLRHALDAVEAQTYPNIAEVIVAAADAVTAAAARGFRVVDNPAGTTPAGLNRAIEASTGEVIVRCDAQASLPPRYVERAIDTLLRTGADNVGGMQVPVGVSPWEKAIAEAMRSRLGAGDAHYRVGGEEGAVETVYLGVFPRGVLQRLGGFDEDFVRNQDYELNHRIIESGGTVWFDPELRVEYRPRGSLAALARQYFEYGRAKRQFNHKHPGALRWRQWAAPVLVAALAASLVASIWFPPVLAVLVAYATGMVIAGATTDASPLRVAAALATMHLSWGVGFWSNRRGVSR